LSIGRIVVHHRTLTFGVRSIAKFASSVSGALSGSRVLF
jgi:hypothetical protein